MCACDHLTNESGFFLENTLRTELDSLIHHYRIIKDYLSGVELTFSNIRERLQSFKDSLSTVRLYLMLQISRQGSSVNISFEPIMNAIDIALVMMESNPSNARQTLQLALSISTVKIEDVMAFLSFIRESM